MIKVTHFDQVYRRDNFDIKVHQIKPKPKVKGEHVAHVFISEIKNARKVAMWISVHQTKEIYYIIVNTGTGTNKLDITDLMRTIENKEENKNGK